MNSVEDLLEGYRRFRKGVYADQAALYRELGEGQNPDIMLIGCADSRADGRTNNGADDPPDASSDDRCAD